MIKTPSSLKLALGALALLTALSLACLTDGGSEEPVPQDSPPTGIGQNNQRFKYEVKSLNATVSGAYTAAWTASDLEFKGYCTFNGAFLEFYGPHTTEIKLSLFLDEPASYAFEAGFGQNPHQGKFGIGLLQVGSPTGDFYTRRADVTTFVFEQTPARPGGGTLKGSMTLNLDNPNKPQDQALLLTLDFEIEFNRHLCS